MNRTSCRALVCLLVAALAGCAQFTTSSTERAQLQSAADAADAAYLDCLNQQAGRYLGTGDDARAIATVARKSCSGAREAAGRAQSALLSTNYILAEREVKATLNALDAKGEATITEQVLNSRSAPPPAAAAALPGPALAPRATAGGRDGYLNCMREQGWRWATVQEPATVIADAAHGRCAGQLADVAGREQVESEGRAIVTGIVLDRKAQPPSAAP
ncbi:MAG: hypothetical protein JNK40_08815 [Chromatiales bacterium]|nr:hypothetical protein [Chromatiales bacterium]